MFMCLFCAGAELRWLIASTEWPDTEEFRDLLNALERTYQDAARGTQSVDVLGAIPGLQTSIGKPDELFKSLDDT